jgi:Ni/Fe-hydrogenase subunit HybB-like protein
MTATHRRTIVKDILWILATVGLVAAIIRFTRGLGPATALNDATPWGLWIGFDVMAGVALAAGGFVIAATVYIFHLEKYRPILRPAVLTAFLGYVAVIIGLICDLGLPWHIWKPIFHWQHHSVLFEVAWCVMLYTTVLALEFSPAVLEHDWFQKPIFDRIAGWLKHLTVIFVIAGVVLSTLHQSSLGSLFLIMPFRVHPLWYSPLLPVLFFISAVGLGLMMVTLEGFFSGYLYDHPLRLNLYAGLGRAAAWVLGLYLVLRLGDLAVRGVLPMALDGTWQAALFLFEIGVSALLPAVLLTIKSVRHSRAGLLTCAVLTVFGMVLNRLSISILAVYRPPGTTYFPNWLEIAVSLGVVSGAALVFLFLTENLKVLDTGPTPPHASSPYARPEFNIETKVYLGRSLWDTVARRSVGIILAVAVAVALLPAAVVESEPVPRMPVRAPLGWDMLVINGNRDANQVDFDHLAHQDRLQQAASGREAICAACHHLNKPGDKATACWECHQDMAVPTSIFDHTLHQIELGGNRSCLTCHQGEHTARTATACVECHDTMTPGPNQASFNYNAPGYKEAMHGTCLSCHQQEALAQKKPELARCPACHILEASIDGSNWQTAQRR